MNVYIVFFGKSQDFTACYYDRNNKIDDFNVIIKDFDLLESKTFTVDEINTSEILSRYFFNSKGKDYCLLKLYSFAQAYSGNRIAGSIYGVGLLADCNINLTQDNLALLRAAKDNFAKLSLDGVKFKRSNFQDDTDRIWKAIVTSNDGNLLDKISTSSLKLNGDEGSIAFHAKDLFQDAIKLAERISTHYTVYFSEDLDHLKRTQGKWGLHAFPFYMEVNNKFVAFDPNESTWEKQYDTNQKVTSKDTSDAVRLRAELDDYQHNNQHLKRDLKKLKDKQKTLIYAVYSLSGILLTVLSLGAFFSFDNEEIIQSPPPTGGSSIEKSTLINAFLQDQASVDSALVLFSNADFIFSFDANKQQNDTLKLYQKFKAIERFSKKHGVNITNVSKAFEIKSSEVMQLKPLSNVSIDSRRKKTSEEVK